MGRHTRKGELEGGDLVVNSSDEHFRALIELSPDAVYVIVNGYHAFANQRGLALLGASKMTDLTTRPALDFMHESVRREAEARLRRMADEHEPLAYVEEKMVRLDGEVVDIEAAGRHINFHGRDGALVVVRDISERLKDAVKLRAAEEKFRAAFQNAPTGMGIVDRAGMFLDVNTALARLFGRRLETLHGDLLWHHVHPEDSERVRSDFDRVLRAAAERMRGALRPTDTIGRIGGDEFVVILKSLPREVPAEEIAHRLAQAVAAPVAFEEGIVNVRASIGQASTDDPDFPAARLLGAADANMYKVKQATRHAEEFVPRQVTAALRAVK